MRVSEYYALGRSQPSLDFVDIDVSGDIPVFLDPRAIRIQPGDWGHDCQALLQSFFGAVLDAIRTEDQPAARELMSRLGEPNETHLGFSKGKARGRGLGRGGAEDVADAISASRAAKSGLLHDLEDTILLVDGIGSDMISDITTHVIRAALIEYTQRTCRWYGIPMEQQHSGALWDPDAQTWIESFTDLPRADGEKLLLVPKSIVRHKLIFDKDKYYNGYLAPLLEQREMDAGSQLVRVLKNKNVKVDRGALRAKYFTSKDDLVQHTIDHPQALERYRASTNLASTPVLSHLELGNTDSSADPDLAELLAQVGAILPGKAGATAYHRAVEELLTALLYPSLANGRVEEAIHEGRKRLDIMYDNVANSGFFRWASLHHAAAVIPVECKNYSEDPANPALDQIGGRLSRDRGLIGMLVCRTFTDKQLFLERCRDTAKDGRGFILALDDDDLAALVARAGRGADGQLHAEPLQLLRDRFQWLIA
jgi:hypothetical protein